MDIREAHTGLANNIFTIQTTQPEPIKTALCTRFAKEKVFIKVVDSLLQLDHGQSLKVQKRVKHKAKDYMIEDGQL